MQIHYAETYTATIYCGFKPGYGSLNRFKKDCIRQAEAICQKYCNEVGFCCTIEPTSFVYKDGNEPGVKVGLINYPRFIKKPSEIKNHAIKIATLLKEAFEQHRVSIICTDETIMLGEK